MKKSTSPHTLNALAQAQANFSAMAGEEMKPALGYTQQEGDACLEGWRESDETVASKAHSKAEFPY